MPGTGGIAITVEWPSLEPRSTAPLQPSVGNINFPPAFTGRRRTRDEAFGDEPEPDPRPHDPQGLPAGAGPHTAEVLDYFEAMVVSPAASHTSGGDPPSLTQEGAASAADAPVTTAAAAATNAPGTALFYANQLFDNFFFDANDDRPATYTATAFEDQLMAEEEERQQQEQGGEDQEDREGQEGQEQEPQEEQEQEDIYRASQYGSCAKSGLLNLRIHMDEIMGGVS